MRLHPAREKCGSGIKKQEKREVETQSARRAADFSPHQAEFKANLGSRGFRYSVLPRAKFGGHEWTV